MSTRTLGLDLGGTNIKVAVLDGAAVVGRRQVAAGADEGPAVVMANVAAAGVAAVAQWGPIDGGRLGRARALRRRHR